MEELLIYIAKASGILLLFYGVYELMLKKETFFNVNRAFLLCGYVLALLLPLVVIKNYVEIPFTSGELLANGSIQNVTPLPEKTASIIFPEILKAIFLLGFGFMGLRFLLQLSSVFRMIRRNQRRKFNGYTLVEVPEKTGPFSFFSYIFYSPGHYPEEEFKAILEHEKEHCRQWHSLDVLFAQLVLILLWINPISWFYLNNVKQNLEFLADRRATQRVTSRKAYEYSLLKISGNLQMVPLTNNFYNSLIKKRIVMLHQSRSNRRNVLKTGIILPVLALFLWSFNSETVYVPSGTEISARAKIEFGIQIVEIQIDKDTSDEELEELKKDLADKGVDFSYTVVHNENKEIIDLSISLSSKEKGSNTFMGTSSFNNDGEPIEPVTLVFDKDNNMFFMGKDGEDLKVIEVNKDISTWVHSDDDVHQTVEIYKDNGKEVIRVNGKEVSREELEEMEKEGKIHKHQVKIEQKVKGDKEHRIMIIGDHDVDHDIEVISGDSNAFFFLDGEVDDNWLILLDGKEVGLDEVRDLDPEKVETINVVKGDEAAKKYGKKAKDGVLEITTLKK